MVGKRLGAASLHSDALLHLEWRAQAELCYLDTLGGSRCHSIRKYHSAGWRKYFDFEVLYCRGDLGLGLASLEEAIHLDLDRNRNSPARHPLSRHMEDLGTLVGDDRQYFCSLHFCHAAVPRIEGSRARQNYRDHLLRICYRQCPLFPGREELDSRG